MHLDLWTLGLQAINVVVLVWLLARFLFRPISAMIAARRQAAETLLADAAAARAKAMADAAEIARRREDFTREGQRILDAAQAEAATQIAAQRAQAAQAIARMRQDAATELARERTATEEAFAVQANALAVMIARRLLARMPEATVTLGFVEALADQLTSLPAEERRRLGGAPIEILTAVPLDAERQAACSRQIAAALDAPAAAIRFRTEPALLAGVELRAPHTLIRNHWQADLERITRELRSDIDHDARPARVA